MGVDLLRQLSIQYCVQISGLLGTLEEPQSKSQKLQILNAMRVRGAALDFTVSVMSQMCKRLPTSL